MALFEIGDNVELKSGGPTMTVERYHSSRDTQLECQWFAGSKLQSGWFEEETLSKVEPEGGELQND